MSIPCVAREEVYAFWCEDGPDGDGLRAQWMAAHLAYVEAHFERYRVAGPLQSEGIAVKSLFVVAAQNLDDAWALMRGDPYVANGLYVRIEAHAFIPAAGSWIGGKVWR